MVGKSGFWTYLLDFSAFFPPRHAESAGIILKLGWKFCIMGLGLCKSASRTVSKRAGANLVKQMGNVG